MNCLFWLLTQMSYMVDSMYLLQVRFYSAPKSWTFRCTGYKPTFNWQVLSTFWLILTLAVTENYAENIKICRNPCQNLWAENCKHTKRASKNWDTKLDFSWLPMTLSNTILLICRNEKLITNTDRGSTTLARRSHDWKQHQCVENTCLLDETK